MMPWPSWDYHTNLQRMKKKECMIFQRIDWVSKIVESNILPMIDKNKTICKIGFKNWLYKIFLKTIHVKSATNSTLSSLSHINMTL